MATKLDGAWQKLFDKHNIHEAIERDGYYIITADQIREFREPRLMTKFDHNEDLPIIFKEAKLSRPSNNCYDKRRRNLLRLEYWSWR